MPIYELTADSLKPIPLLCIGKLSRVDGPPHARLATQEAGNAKLNEIRQSVFWFRTCKWQ